MEEEPLSDEMELLEAVILNCRGVGEFRILSTSITSEQARIVTQFCIRGRNCTAIRKKSRFESWCKLKVFHDLLMEEVSFLFILLGLISVRELVDIELYSNNMYAQNTEDQNANNLCGSIKVFFICTLDALYICLGVH